jgi:hypothetical protein
MRIVCVLLCLGLGFRVQAEAPVKEGASPSARRVERALGDPVRVHTEGGTVDGRLLEIGTESLTLDVGASQLLQESLPLAGVQALSVRGRYAGTGAAVGAAAGTFAGAFLGMFFCLFGDGSTVNGCAPASLLTALGGGVGVAGLGAFVGSLISSWDPIYDRTEEGPLSVAPQRAPPEVWARSAGRQSWPSAGQFGVFLSHALLLGSSGSPPVGSDFYGLGGRLNGLAQMGPYVAVGPELTVHRLFGSEERVPDRFVASLGVLARASPRPSRLTPSFMVGGAGHSLGLLSYSVGAGLDLRVAHATALALELHWHRIFAGNEVDEQLTLGLGVRSF